MSVVLSEPVDKKVRNEMFVPNVIWMPALFAVLAMVVVACGGSDPTDTPPLPTTAAATPTAAAISQQEPLETSAEENLYLGQVTDAEFLMARVFEGFQGIFGRTYPVREALLAALLEGGVGTPFIDKLAALEALDPPARYREDHRIWLDATRESLQIDTEAAQAVRDDNLVRFSHLNAQLAEINVRARLALSPGFCRKVALRPDQTVFCTTEESVFNGEYEFGINDLMREFMPAFASAQGSLGFRLSLTPEELDQVLSDIASDSLALFQGSVTALKRFTPPDEWIADNERLQAFFGRVVDIVREAEGLREEGDLDAARGELLRLDPTFCASRASFEAGAFKDAVAIFFIGTPQSCGGVPF